MEDFTSFKWKLNGSNIACKLPFDHIKNYELDYSHAPGFQIVVRTTGSTTSEEAKEVAKHLYQFLSTPPLSTPSIGEAKTEALQGNYESMQQTNQALVKRLQAASAVLKAYEAWEANVINEDAAWNTPAAHPWQTDELYDEWMELQAQRNAVLYPGKYSAPESDPFATTPAPVPEQKQSAKYGVDAFCYSGTLYELDQWLQSLGYEPWQTASEDGPAISLTDSDTPELEIQTAEGPIYARIGDYIIHRANGEFATAQGDVFRKNLGKTLAELLGILSPLPELPNLDERREGWYDGRNAERTAVSNFLGYHMDRLGIRRPSGQQPAPKEEAKP